MNYLVFFEDYSINSISYSLDDSKIYFPEFVNTFFAGKVMVS
jgi:hypothetical protein